MTTQRDTTAIAWHAVWTYSRQEKILARELERMGVRCLLPLRDESRDYCGVSVRVETPIILGCVFLHGSNAAVASALATGRVRRVTEIPLELCGGLPIDARDQLELDGAAATD
jgi:hypothetical protein